MDTVYVREAKGLFIEKKLLRHSEGREVWVDVRGAATVAATTIGDMFQVPADLAIQRGDLVATRMGDDSALAFKLIAIPNKITRLVAPHDSLMAMTFGLPKAPGMVNLSLNAKAY